MAFITSTYIEVTPVGKQSTLMKYYIKKLYIIPVVKKILRSNVLVIIALRLDRYVPCTIIVYYINLLYNIRGRRGTGALGYHCKAMVVVQFRL